MSDDFIPLNQSTPTTHAIRNPNQSFEHNRFSNGNRRRGGQNNRWGNNSRNSSFGSDNSFGQDRSNRSFSYERTSIDAYLHPSMLEDPWAKLKQNQNVVNKSS